MTIDAEDMIWVAQWAGWGVSRFNPRTGELLQRIDVPAAQVTACAFGGPDLEDLYITTARRGIEGAALERQPHAGSLFHAKPGVRGVPSFRYAG
jgi:sugar lactone lactonase YvrE